MTNGRKWAATLLAAVALTQVGGRASAATSAGVTLRVTVSVALSVAMNDTQYDFGTIGAGVVTVSTRAITITNDSGGLTEDYTINASTFIVTGGTDWNINSDALTAGVNIFSLCAHLGTTQPAANGTTFDATDCFDNATAVEQMTAGLFNGAGSDLSGDNVANAGARLIWFRFVSPTEITSGNGAQQSMTVTVTANASSLF